MKKMLIFFGLFSVLAVVLTATAVFSRRDALYILIWDEYIDEDLIEDFEIEYNCKVILDIAESNEIMYSQISRDSAPYDIAIPSDYMIDQMYQDGLLIELDYDLFETYKQSDLDPNLNQKINEYASETKNYFVPYFWGSLGILYNKDLLSESDQQRLQEEGWKVLFDNSFSNKMAMYASSRDSIAAALMANGFSLNTKNKEELAIAEKSLAKMNYKAWATDDLKVGVASGKYSLSLAYTGDYFDIVYSSLDAGVALEDLNFDFYCPKDANNVFFDAMVIPKTSENTELAHKFIDFMSRHDNSLKNAQYVGYCPTLTSVYEAMLSDEDYMEVASLDPYYPGDIDKGEIYQYLGSDIYMLYEEIYKRVKK